MNDEDIEKLATKLTQSLATKDDIQRLESKIDDLDHNRPICFFSGGREKPSGKLIKKLRQNQLNCFS